MSNSLQHPKFANRILATISEETVARLQLRRVELPVETELEFPGNRIEHLFFLESGVASMTATFSDGRQAEIGLFGFESAVGASALMGTKRSLNRVYMQIGGFGYAAPFGAAAREFRLCGDFHDLVLRYVQAQLVQVAQSAGCNLVHHLEQRLARWLLLCADRSRNDTFHLSQEFLGMMLGVQRSSVNTAVAHLVDKGLLELRRNQIRIIDSPGLVNESCECYSVVKNHLDNFAEYDSGQER